MSDRLYEEQLPIAPTQDNPVLHNLEAYWQTLRHAARVPARNDVSPRMIDNALPHAFILQRVAPGTARFRVAGQKLHELLKMDARGMPWSTLFQPQARTHTQELLETAFDAPAIVQIPLVSHGSLLKPALTGTMLLLPMRDSADNTTRILGALVTDQEPGSRPRRFDIAAEGPLRIEPIGPQLATSRATPLGMQKGPDASRPALRLVVNNG